MMQGIRNELNHRDEEINKVIRFIENSERRRTKSPSFDVRVDIKASVLLMLYNEVESLITATLTRIHEIVLSGTYSYSELSTPVKKLIENYYMVIQNKSESSATGIFYVEHIEVIFDRIMVNLPYAQMVQTIQLYSGNLDSRSINGILKMYGVNEIKGVSELKTIKDIRNQLAHGEYSFEEIGRTVTYQQLEIMRQRTRTYLEEVVNAFEKYLNNHEYRIS